MPGPPVTCPRALMCGSPRWSTVVNVMTLWGVDVVAKAPPPSCFFKGFSQGLQEELGLPVVFLGGRRFESHVQNGTCMCLLPESCQWGGRIGFFRLPTL